MGIRLLGSALLVACSAIAQGPSTGASGSPSPALQAELKHLAATAQSLQHDLPSFTCKETAVSQAIKINKGNPRKNKVQTHVQFAAGVRAERGRDGRLHESLDVTEINGKPASGRRFDPPVMVEGGFDQTLDFFLPARQACFNFTMDQGRIDFVSQPGSFDRAECGEMGAPSGFALLDDAGNVTHLERQDPPDRALQAHVVNFASVDFSPIELDGTVYPLPAKVVAEVPQQDDTFHFEAAYAGCRLFKATTTILPSVTPVPEGGPAPSHP